jgi:hypothetical protein
MLGFRPLALRGLGSSLLPAELASRDLGVFEEMKCLFFLYAVVEIWRRCHIVFYEL